MIIFVGSTRGDIYRKISLVDQQNKSNNELKFENKYLVCFIQL
jgi:hypothetical protein